MAHLLLLALAILCLMDWSSNELYEIINSKYSA